MIKRRSSGTCVFVLMLLSLAAARAEARDPHGLRHRLRVYGSSGGDRRGLVRRIILLRAGETFVGHFTLRAKAGTGVILIRSDAADTETARRRRTPGAVDASGSNTPLDRLARIIGRGGAYKSVPLLRTEPGAHGYVVQFLDFDGVSHLGYETLIQMGEDTTVAAPVRHHLRPRLCARSTGTRDRSAASR